MLPFLGVFYQKLGDSLLRYPIRGFSVGVHEVDRAGKGRLGVQAPCLHLWLHLLHSSFPGPWEFLQQAIFIPSLGPFHTSTIFFPLRTFAHLSGFNPNHTGLGVPNRVSPALSLGAQGPAILLVNWRLPEGRDKDWEGSVL